jgi:hypothetical protein
MEFKEEIIRICKLTFGAMLSLMSSLINPIHDFVVAIMVLATINIIMGALADTYWSFKKAFKAFIYLGGYLLLLILSVLVSKLMHIKHGDTVEFTSWITWVMIWFYIVNILRNWGIRQPDNRVIKFFYWVVSFKIVEKIKFLKEFNDKEKENE